MDSTVKFGEGRRLHTPFHLHVATVSLTVVAVATFLKRGRFFAHLSKSESKGRVVTKSRRKNGAENIQRETLPLPLQTTHNQWRHKRAMRWRIPKDASCSYACIAEHMVSPTRIQLQVCWLISFYRPRSLNSIILEYAFLSTKSFDVQERLLHIIPGRLSLPPLLTEYLILFHSRRSF